MKLGERPKILIVDDEEDICELLGRWLGGQGYACAAASNGEEALRMLKSSAFDLVLADIMMPGMSGIDLLNIIKTLFPDVAVLMITAVDDCQTGILAIELGAYGYMIKPLDKNDILINVANALQRRIEKLSGLHSTNHVEVRERSKNYRGREVARADEAVNCIRSGMDDAALAERFNLSFSGLQRLFEELIGAGKLTESEIYERNLLSQGSVVVDIAEAKLPDASPRKPVIDASEALQYIRDGMSDSALMKRYNISAKGLESLFKKLVAAGVLDHSDIEKRVMKGGNSRTGE
jgi:CheY-like chemotaxis protein